MPRLSGHERRCQLLEVATRLFALRGFEATTTAAIAAAAGVSEPVLYRHFKTKQELFQTIIRNVTRSTQEFWQSHLSSISDPAEAFRFMSLKWPEHMKLRATEYAVILRALATSRDEQVVAELREHYQQLEVFFVQLLRQGQEQGVYRRDLDLTTAAWWIISSGVGFTLLALGMGVPPGYDVQHGIELTLRAIVHPGGPVP